MTNPTAVAEPEVNVNAMLGVGDPLGDLSDALSVADPHAPLDGSVPAESPETPTNADPTSESPEADSDTPDPEAPDAETPPVSEAPDDGHTPDAWDTLAKSGTPLTYTVDGQKKTFDGILEVAGKGAVIPLDQLPRVRDAIQRREYLDEANRKLYSETERYKALGGIEGYQRTETDFARQGAAGEVLTSLLSNANELAALLVQKPDGSLGFNDQRVEFLRDRMRVAADRAEFDAQRKWTEKLQATERSVNAPEQEASLITQEIRQFAGDLPEDEQAKVAEFVNEYRSAFLRTTTPADIERWPTAGLVVGDKMFDRPKLQKHIEGVRNGLTTRVTTQAKKAEAAKFNAAVKPVAKAVQKSLPPRKDNGQFKEEKKQPPSRYERKLRALSGKPLFDDENG